LPQPFFNSFSLPKSSTESDSALPQISNPPPSINAHNYIVLDPVNHVVISQKAASEKIYPASTTKLVTALTALDHFALTDEFTVTRAYPDGQDLGFKPGEKVSVEELIYALLIQSANDAAEILAENYPGGRSEFVAAMNIKSTTMSLKDTTFKNPTGLDEEGHTTTAADLARIAQVTIENPFLKRIVASENAVIQSPDSSKSHILTNTNELLGKVPGVLGIKTGFTDKAGQALITYVSRNDHPLIFVVLGSEDRASDSQQLIEWAYTSVTWP
jgi:D-alanyl-D-alanine carboxypeptidase (penicillin-binding protein 5/6)